MSIAGASETLTGKFLDAGGAWYNAAHPDFGSSNDETVVTAAIAQAHADGGGLIFIPPTVTQAAVPALYADTAMLQIQDGIIRLSETTVITTLNVEYVAGVQLHLGDPSTIPVGYGTGGAITINGDFTNGTGSGFVKDLIVATGTLSSVGDPIGITAAPTFLILENGDLVAGGSFGATEIDNSGGYTGIVYHALSAFKPATVSGTIAEAYGLEIFDMDIATTNYALKTNAGLVSFGDTVITSASTTARAGLRLGHGTAPTSPTNGDLWTTTGGLFARINGSTVGPFATGLTGSGTTNRLTKWTGASAVGNSILSDDGSVVTVIGGRLTVATVASTLGLVITQPSGSLTNAIQISGGTDTGGGGPIVSISQTWNSGGTTFVGFDMNITSAASDANSLIMRLRLASSTVFSVARDGAIYTAGSLFVTGDVELNGIINVLTGVINCDDGSESAVAVDVSGLSSGDHGLFGAGNVSVGVAIHGLGERVRVDDSVTATHTSLLVFDVDGNTLARVKKGANDSGGTGLAALVIDNT